MSDTAMPYLNRELSMLDFHSRVLEQARDRRAPLLERVRFLAIVGMIIDDFFQIRVAGLRRQVAAGSANTAPDGLTPAEQLARIRQRVGQLTAAHHACYQEVREQLAAHEVHLLEYGRAGEHHAQLRQRFVEEIFPS
jgi:polyphosphate kinase